MTAANSLTDLRVNLVASVTPRHPWYRLAHLDGGGYQIVNTEGDPLYPVVEHLDRQRVLDVIQLAVDNSTYQGWVVRLELESDATMENPDVEIPPVQPTDYATADMIARTIVSVASTLEHAARCRDVVITDEQIYGIFLKSMDKMLDLVGGVETARITLAATLTQLVMAKREGNPL